MTPAVDVAAAADSAAEAALSVEGVAGLHGGSFGEVATYLPGRRVTGVSVREDGTSVHLVVDFGVDVRSVAQEVRRAVASVAPQPVEVVVEDVADSEIVQGR